MTFQIAKPKRTIGFDALLSEVRNWPEFGRAFPTLRQIRFQKRVHDVDQGVHGWGFWLIIRKYEGAWRARISVGTVGAWTGNHATTIPPEHKEKIEFALSEFIVKLQALTGTIETWFP